MARVEFGLFLDLATEGVTIDTHLATYGPLVELAASQGITSVWAGESYPRGAAGGFQHVPGPMLVLSALAASGAMRMGTAVTIAPAWQPLRLAYDALVMDQLTGGRFELGLGLGTAPTWKQFGVDPTTVGEWLDELIDALKALWSGADGFEGRLIRIAGGIGPRPIQAGGPPIWVGGKIGRSARRAALRGDGYLAGTHFGMSLVLRQIERYRQALRDAGRDRASGRVSVNRIVVLADDEEVAWRDGGPYVARLLRKYASLRMFPGAERLAEANPSDEAAVRAAARGMCLVGSPADVLRDLETLADAGVTQVQLRPAPGGMPAELVARTLELAGREVVPRFS